jgi:demethylmenaquinone methyltransferase/2-methoxy-6-polyprenyl-1,4-benzoquinol methylase
MQSPQARVVAADFTLEMMRVGQKRGALNFSSADALQLPFNDAAFDAVVSGFLMRNVIDLQKALQEQYRVLKKKLHMHFVIPALGRLLTGSRDAYRYLPETTEGFVTAENLASRMAAAGFRKINFQRFMFGTIAIHWGER